jgi:hypothetical protein
MSSRTVSGVVPAQLQEVAQQAAAYEGTSVSALVSSALTLCLGLSGSARRTARYVLASDSPEAREALPEGCGRAIAAAGDHELRGRLAARGEAMGLADRALSEQDIAREAVDAVAAVRRTQKRREHAG